MRIQRRQLLRGLSFGFASTFIVNLFSPKHFALAQTAAQPTSGRGEAHMERVTGIGGLFFRAHDPRALSDWYDKHLGVTPVPKRHNDPVWQQEAGPTAFSPFPETTDYFGDRQKGWMLNFRVRDLDKMVAQLQAAGIAVKVDPQSSPVGRFARLHDPEGNPIELWQP
jgi:predicted enzyme related to lactoylglutathione lyase